MNRIAKICTACAAALVLGFGVTACEDDSQGGSTQKREADAKQSNYDKQVRNQPSHEMDYSPTRDAINAWIDTWEKRGKLSYVYIQNAKGQYGYFVMKGLPVPRCKMLTPPEKGVWSGANDSGVVLPQPGMDGVYSSGAGTCNSYFGFDATTNAYMEFTVGMNQSFFLFDQPVTLPEFADAKQMGPTAIKK